MKTDAKPISIAETISPIPLEPAVDIETWQTEKLRERHKAADAGRFASMQAMQAVIRKFIPDG
jgi:hypothetical protein